MRKRHHKDPAVSEAYRQGRADARSDRRAGGFGLGNRRPVSDKPEAETNAYDRGYVRGAPRRWRK